MERNPTITRILVLAATLWLGACDGSGDGGTTDGATASSAAGGAVAAEGALGPVTATLTMDPAEPRFGERVRLVLEIVATSDAELAPLELDARLGHFRIRGREQEGRAEDGRVRHTIAAEPEKTGTNICRPPPIRFRIKSGEGAGDDERELVLEPFEVEVPGLSPDQQPDLADLGTPLGPITLPTGGAASRTAWLTAAALLLALTVLLVWWRRRRRTAEAEAPVQDPGDEAAAAFARLLRRGLVADGRFAEFYVALTSIVRRYVERTTGIHAPEQTTEEFLREMETAPSFDPGQRNRLSAFLQASDLVKFAAQVPSEREIDESVRSAKSFCDLDPATGEVAAA